MDLRVDPDRPLSPSMQVVEAVLDEVASGALRAGDRLPSVRDAAVSALVNPNTIARAWRELEVLGVVEGKAGAGVFVTPLGPDVARRERRAVSERIAFVPDRPDAWGFMTVRDLARFLRAHHPRWNQGVADALFAELRVPTDRPLGKMSRGEAAKAMFAASLGHEPEVLLLDEPFGGLDPLVHDEVLAGMVGALGSGARTVLIATHDLDVAARVGDRVAVLAGGKIARDLPVGAAVGGARARA